VRWMPVLQGTPGMFETRRLRRTDSGRPAWKTGGTSALLPFSFVDLLCVLFGLLCVFCSATFQAALLCQYLIQRFLGVCSSSPHALFVTSVVPSVERLVIRNVIVQQRHVSAVLHRVLRLTGTCVARQHSMLRRSLVSFV
jgi:hypothetical protein